MENAPHILLIGRNLPPDVEGRYLKWYDEVYSPTFVKMLGYTGIDNYRITKKAFEYPNTFSIHHYQNRNTIEMDDGAANTGTWTRLEAKNYQGVPKKRVDALPGLGRR